MDQARNLRAAFNAGNKTQRKSRRGTRGGKPPLVVAITSGKGGVGKSHLSANLAWELTNRGNRVLVLDADLGLANINILIGVQPQYDIHDFLNGERTLREVLVKGPGGMTLLPAASGITEMTRLSEEKKMYLLTELEELESEFDVLLIDTAAGINDNVTYFASSAQEVAVVVTPEPTSMADGYAIMKVLHNEHRVNNFSLVVNQVEDARVGRNVYGQLAEMTDTYLGMSIDYMGEVFSDPNVKKAILGQHLLMENYPTSKASNGIRKICDQLLNKREQLWLNGKLQFFWKRMLES